MSEAFAELPSLVVVGGPLDGHEMKLSPGTTLVIGSGRLAQLRVEHPEIELAHVKVTWDDLGLSMTDNGSRKGTWVNGEQVESAGLIDGDVIEFAAPGTRSAPPKIRIRIPAGAVPEEAPAPQPPGAQPGARASAEPPPRAAPAGAVVRGRAPSRRHSPRLGLPLDPAHLKLVGLGLGAFVLVFGGTWLAKRLFFTAPRITSLQPAQSEPGAILTITGRRFAGAAEKNMVWFADRSYPALSASGDTLQVKVPDLQRQGTVAVSVENPYGRSGSLPLVLLTPLKADGTSPGGALPGDEVVLTGGGFGDGGVTVTVGGVEAKVIATEPTGVRFEMPQVPGEPGSQLAVVAAVGARRTAPVALYLGRVPLLLAFDPPRAVAGEIVRIRGVGFAAAPAANRVTFDGVPVLVVAASATELVVVAPPPPGQQAERRAQVVVRAGGRTSSDGSTYALLRLVEGAWIPRFIAGAVGEAGGEDLAVVGTEIAPVLILGDGDDARSVGERALRVAGALNAAVDRVRVGQATAFEARLQPAVGVAVVGSAELLVRVTPQDAAVYGVPPGLVARGAPPAPLALAQYWAALLNDYLVVGTSAARPEAAAALSTAAGAAMRELRTALPWQFGSGIPADRVASLPAELRRRLREAAFRVP